MCHSFGGSYIVLMPVVPKDFKLQPEEMAVPLGELLDFYEHNQRAANPRMYRVMRPADCGDGENKRWEPTMASVEEMTMHDIVACFVKPETRARHIESNAEQADAVAVARTGSQFADGNQGGCSLAELFSMRRNPGIHAMDQADRKKLYREFFFVSHCWCGSPPLPSVWH